MPHATLLLREDTSSCTLSSLVDRAAHHRATHRPYRLELTATQLTLTPLKSAQPPAPPPDEGFESDIDSLSIVSSDSSIPPKTTETDSANGSSDSDDTELSAPSNHIETHSLVDCVCYTDVKYPTYLIFVIKSEGLVFDFGPNQTELQTFYLNFTALKAVIGTNTRQRSAKFNLLQRTDRNGVTHIEITREPPADPPRSACYRSSSSDNLLSDLVKNSSANNSELRKVWNSAEDLLEQPRRPDRTRRRQKGKAPPPPPQTKENMSDVLRGEYVRVNVSSNVQSSFIAKSQEKKPVTRSNLVTLLSSKASNHSTWTNSVPRMLLRQKKVPIMQPPPPPPMMHKVLVPMAYRYIDSAHYATQAQQMNSRFFGLSSKLRDFNTISGRQMGNDFGGNGSNLKSVIKKESENKAKSGRGAEKKVTFSAYTTVQVV